MTAVCRKRPKINVVEKIRKDCEQEKENPLEAYRLNHSNNRENYKREKSMPLTIDDLRKIKKENPHAIPYYKYCSENRDIYKKMFEVLDNEMKLEIYGDSAGVLKALELIRGIDGIDWHLENK